MKIPLRPPLAVKRLVRFHGEREGRRSIHHKVC